MQRIAALLALAVQALASPNALPGQETTAPAPIRRTISFEGVEREYFLYLPRGFDRSRTYWPLVVVHGGGQIGSTQFPNASVARFAVEAGLEAIVISPSFSNVDNNASRFPSLGEDRFLDAVLDNVRTEYSLRPKLLLTGYSRGGQFTHRYALAHPERVAAVAPLASGTWTTPDGRLLVEEIGEVRDARAFLSDTVNASKIPERLRNLFDRRVADVAETGAVDGSRAVPFLVMCGTLDPRLPIAKEFARTLQSLGYQVSVDWPRTPHTCQGDAACRAEYGAEFDTYSRRTVDFFREVVRR